MQCRCFFAVFISFQCFVCAVIFHHVFCLLVVQLLMRFCFFRKNFQYAVARCVGYFTTTFCAEMQWRCFFAVFISFQCFVCAVIFHRVIFVCSLCRYICDFVSFVKILNMQLQCVLVFFNNVLCRNAMSVFLCSFHQLSMFCLCSNLSPCILSVGCAVAPAILFFAEVFVFLYVNCRGGCRKKYHGRAVCLFQLFVLRSGFVA